MVILDLEYLENTFDNQSVEGSNGFISRVARASSTASAGATVLLFATGAITFSVATSFFFEVSATASSKSQSVAGG